VKRVAVLGSTGSIGTQTLDVLRRFPDAFDVVALAAGRASPALQAQVDEWEPDFVALAGSEYTASRSDIEGSRALVGPDALERLVDVADPDVIVLGTPGLVGLRACLAALRAGKVVAVANKEPLVAAGALVTETARQFGGTIVPVDSEHNGIWQCLRGEEHSTIAQIVLTTSGGAFRDVPLEELPSMSAEQSLHHPTWSMGPKITVDSATLMNKGLEIIEASWLFGVSTSLVNVVLHRQSIVHALVEFADGSIKAQLSVPDMRFPIANALMYPQRMCADLPRLRIHEIGSLTFEQVDEDRYPSLGVALQAAATGGASPTVLNGANEIAVERFLANEIRFTDIVPLIEATLDRHKNGSVSSVEEIFEADAWARETCAGLTP
jgi:1-deoxy-D-xylulose-5-phosphate reductoisomerase